MNEVKSVILWKPHCALRVMRMTSYLLKSYNEGIWKTFTGLGPLIVFWIFMIALTLLMYKHVYICMYAYTYTCMCMYMYVCMYVSQYTTAYIHTLTAQKINFFLELAAFKHYHYNTQQSQCINVTYGVSTVAPKLFCVIKGKNN